MSFNPYMTTAERHAEIMARDAQERGLGAEDDLVSTEVISTPTGSHYGVDGHVPCKHVVVFTYRDGHRMVASTQPNSGHYVWQRRNALIGSRATLVVVDDLQA